MKNRKWLLGLLAVASMACPAQDLPAGEAAQPDATPATPAAEAAAPEAGQPMTPQADSGMDAITAVQNQPAAPLTSVGTATEKLRKYLEQQGWREGWDPEKERYLVIQEAELTCADPSSDDSYVLKRALKAKAAYLRARVEVAEWILSEMSAKDQLETPGTDIDKELGVERDQLERLLVAQQQVIAELAAEYDQAEADQLRGVTWGDRMKALMDACIKRLDKEYSVGKIDAAKRDRYEKAKAQYQSATRQHEQLVTKAEQMRSTLTERVTSSVVATARQPLYGVTAIKQAESWSRDKGIYQVAVLCVWSKKLERAARAVVTGDDDFRVKSDLPTKSLDAWIRELDLSSAIGPRQYLDDKGNRWFLGVAASALGKSASSRSKAKVSAELFAKSEAVFALFADVESFKEAKAAMETRDYGGNDESLAADSVATKLTQKFEKRSVRGLQKITAKEVVHPISQQEIYVVVYAASPADAKTALEVEKINYATRIEDLKHQSWEAGHKKALNDAVDNAKDDPASYNQGYQKGGSSLADEAAKRDAAKQPVPDPATAQPAAAKKQPAGTKKPQEGVFGGDEKVKDDF
jgi:hypothetical protein